MAFRRADNFEFHEEVERTMHELHAQQGKFCPKAFRRRARSTWAGWKSEERDAKRCEERICGSDVSDYDRQFLPEQYAQEPVQFL